MAVYALSKIFLSVPIGNVSDKISCKKTLTAAIGLYTLIAFLYLFADDISIIILLRFLQGFASALLRPTLLSYINTIADDDNIASVSGKFDISFYSALGLGPVCGGIIRNYCGFYGLFITMSIICTLALFTSATFMKDNDSGSRSKYQKQEFITPNIFALMIFIFGRTIGISTVFTFLPIFIENSLHLDSMQTGIILAASTVSMTLLLSTFGRIGDIVPKTALITTGGICASFFITILPITSDFISILVFSAILGISGAMSQPPSVAMLLEEGGKCGIGKASGYFNLSMNAGFALGPVLGSILMAHYGINTVFYISGSVGILFTLSFLLISSGFKAVTRPD